MRSDDLQFLYRQLRSALDASYAGKPWHAACLDRIAADLLSLEHTLVAEFQVRTAASPMSLAAPGQADAVPIP